MSKKTKRPPGRPPGPYVGGYVPAHLRKENFSIRLPAWLKARLQRRSESPSHYVERLILNDTNWKEPKE